MRRTLAAIGVVAACVTLEAALPAPHGPINDFAGILNPPTLTELSTLVDGVRDATSAEIAVVTVKSLDGLTVEEYANKLFAAWGIGKKGRDNGVLVLVAPIEKKVRIEVGYGLEPVLPDGLSGQIIRDEMLPEFKAGDFSGGVLRGTRHVADIIRTNHTLTPAEREALTAITRSQRIMLTIVILFFMPFFLGTLGYSVRTRSLPGAMFGILGVPVMLGPFLIPGAGPVMRWLVGTTGILAVIAGWWSAAGERRSLEHGIKKRKFGWIASLSSGPRAKWSGSSSSGGGGGFGGGSSGGGGASGSW